MLSARLLRWKWLAFVRRNISRPVRGFCRNTARNFSSGWEKRKAPCAPPFAGPVVKRRSLTICPQTTASKSRKALRNFAPSRLRLRLPLTHMAASRKKSSVCRFPSRLGSSSRCLLQTFHCRISRETPSSSTPSAETSFFFIFGPRRRHPAPANCGFSRSIGQIGPRATFAFSVSISMILRTQERCAPLPQKKAFLCRFCWQRRKWQASTTSSTAICSTAGEISRSQLLSCSTGTP